MATPVLLYDHPASICSQMARLALVEKSVPFERQTIDIMETAEQFEPWYTALNPRAVVPTLRIGDEITTDTIRIVHHVDRTFDGPSLTPADPAAAAAMEAMMADIMGLHYGVLLYSRRLDADGKAPTVIERGEFLRQHAPSSIPSAPRFSIAASPATSACSASSRIRRRPGSTSATRGLWSAGSARR